MPSKVKFDKVALIKQDFEAADAVWIVDYRGLTVKQTEELRANIRKVGAQIKVYKNSLTERALSELAFPELGAVLGHPSAFVFATGDPVVSAKVIKSFAKDNNELEIKGGMFEKAPVSAAQVIDIASLPSREELIAQVVGLPDSPVREVLGLIEPSGTIFGLLDAVEAKAA